MKGNRLVISAFSLSLSLVFYACDNKSQKTVPQSEFSEKSDTIKNEYAKGFRMISTNNGMKVDILDPTSQAIIHSYLIGKGDGINVYSNDITNVVALSVTHVGMMRKLELADKITGVSNLKFLCRPLNEQQVMSVGDLETSNPELIMSAHPDIIFYSGFNLESPTLKKLDQAGLRTFLIYDWKETHPLGRAEWLKVFGVLFKKEKEANDLFYDIRTRYQKIKNKLANTDKKPTVLAGTYWGEFFNAPKGESYQAQLLRDANVNYVYGNTEGSGSLSLSLESVVTENLETDFWINAAAATMGELHKQSQKFEIMAAVRSRNIYTYLESGNCYWENAPIEPDVVLEDLGKIFYPEKFKDKEFTYYAKIKK